jgi:cytoskeletal protein RodZ
MSTFGEELRRERKLRGFRLREVADATKINLRYLEALEGNDFEHLPGGVFNRGFVRAYSQFIGVDPDAMVNAYLLEEQAQKGEGKVWDKQLFRRPRNDPAKPPSEERAEPKPRRRALFHAAWITLLLLLALVLGWAADRYLDIDIWNQDPKGEQSE